MTQWNGDHTQLAIAWSDQKDIVKFTKSPDGRTRINLTRAGKELVSVE